MLNFHLGRMKVPRMVFANIHEYLSPELFSCKGVAIKK